MKWDIIKSTWQYKEPEFWSVCNWSHRFNSWKDGLYFPDELNCICTKCNTWWAKWTHNRHDESLPPYFKPDGSINDPFYLKHTTDGFLYPNPEYTYGNYRKWLNGKGVALKRERYPDA